MCLILLEGCKQAQPNSSTSRGSKSSIILFSQSINNPIISTVGYDNDEQEVTVRKGRDNCIYYEFREGKDKKTFLPILTNGFATSEQLSDFYNKNINKKIKVRHGSVIDKLNEKLPQNSIYWLSQPPYKQCQGVSEAVFDYSTISKYEINKIAVDSSQRRQEAQNIVSLVFYPPELDINSSEAIKKWSKNLKAKIILENNCIYIEDKSKKRIFPIFRMPKVIVSDNGENLIINNHKFNFNEFYDFTLFEKINKNDINSSTAFNFIKTPSSKCLGSNFSELEYVIDIK